MNPTASDSAAEHRRGGQHADLQGVEAQEQQMCGQQHRDGAVGQRAQCARRQDQPGVAVGRWRQQAHGFNLRSPTAHRDSAAPRWEARRDSKTSGRCSAS
jgi:hypothetical protein